MVWKIGFLLVFFAIMIGVGIYCKKHATDVNGFVLGGRSVGPWLTAFAYGTSYFSAVIFIGYAGKFGWNYGIAATWIGIGNAVLGSLLAWVVLGRRTRIMTQTLQTKTMPEFFEKRYNSKALKIIGSAITFIFLIPYTASLYNGLSRLFNMAFGWDYMWCVIGMSVLTAIYVVVGGYMATAINDFIQGIIMLFGIIAVIAAVLSSHGGFFGSLKELANVDATGAGPVAAPGAFASMFGPDPINLLGVVILTSLGTWGLPQMVQKFYAIKSEKSIKTGAIISTVFAIIVAGGCYFLGGFARISPVQVKADGTPVGGSDAVIPAMLENLPDILMAVVIVLVLSASMSTLSSLVLTSSSSLTLDFIKGGFKKDMKEKTQLSIMRIFIIVFIVISAAIAIFQVKAESSAVKFIADLMGVSWGALAGSFLAPFLYGLYAKWASKIATVVCMIFGSGLMVANLIFLESFPKILQSPINCGAAAMIGSLILFPIVCLITKKPSKETVDKAFTGLTKRLAEK